MINFPENPFRPSLFVLAVYFLSISQMEQQMKTFRNGEIASDPDTWKDG